MQGGAHDQPDLGRAQQLVLHVDVQRRTGLDGLDQAHNAADAAQAGEQVWELDWVSGEQNRVVQTKICSGDKMLLSNVEISAPRDGFCQLTGNFVIFGAISFS